jgi:hypothetical protein
VKTESAPSRDERAGPQAASAAEPGARSHRRTSAPRLRGDGALYCLKVFLTVRVALLLIALMAVALLPDLSRLSPAVRAGLPAIPSPVSVPGWPAHVVTPGWHNAVTAWERFDALWFLRIATHGYRDGDGSAAFSPLYPISTRAVSFLVGHHPLAASLIVSNLSFLGALLVLYALTARELDESTARRAVLYTAVFPTALFFFAPYSESLFLLLSVLALWWARGRRWELAGVAGALAALTRNVGILLVLPLGVEAVHHAMASRPRRFPWRGLAAAAGPGLGALGYAAYWHHVSGDWLAPIHQQTQWERHLADPAMAVVRGSQIAFRFVGAYPGGYHFYDWLIAVPVLAFALYAAVKLRPAYGAYAVASLVVPLSFVFDGRPLMSFPRFAAVVFPVMWGMAMWTRARPVRHEGVIVASSVLLGLSTLLFATWYYVF